MELITILESAVEKKASDIFIIPGAFLSMKVKGVILADESVRIMPEESEELIHQIFKADRDRDFEKFLISGDDDFSISFKGLGRFRCNVYKQRGSFAAVLRVVTFELPDAKRFHIPKVVIDLYKEKNGMVLITGPAGSGKSTTLACIIDQINHHLGKHIITIEDPIEFMHMHRKSIVSQREIHHDTINYNTALRAALRQAPNVILLGEMRDYETIQTALTAAETGQLMLSTLHTTGAAKTIDRIIDVFPPNQQQQIRVQLSMVLRAVVSQQLVPTVDGGIEPAFEIMIVNSAIQNLIRESKAYQIDNILLSGSAQGMRTMDSDLLRLYHEKRIDADTAILYATNPESLRKKLNL
ncbi:MAG: type IV pilus twitching motility protein PilT [Anaerofustis sp.]